MTTTDTARLQRLRRLAARRGWRLRTIPERSRMRAEYGPYLLTHLETGMPGPRGMSLDEIDAFLEGEALRDHGRIEV